MVQLQLWWVTKVKGTTTTGVFNSILENFHIKNELLSWPSWPWNEHHQSWLWEHVFQVYFFDTDEISVYSTGNHMCPCSLIAVTFKNWYLSNLTQTSFFTIARSRSKGSVINYSYFRGTFSLYFGFVASKGTFERVFLLMPLTQQHVSIFFPLMGWFTGSKVFDPQQNHVNQVQSALKKLLVQKRVILCM